MQFLVVARDGTDPGAYDRRQKLREGHLRNIRQLKMTGNYVLGGALLDDEGEPIGSSIVYDFPDRAALDAAIAADPYAEGKVWQDITVYPFKAAPV